MDSTEWLVALVISIGLVGIIFPIFPGSILVLAAILGWAWQESSTFGWVVFGLAAVVLVAGAVVKFLIPGKRLKAQGVPNATLLLGALVAIVGFFVVPVVGFFLGFVLGIYLAEYRRVGAAEAWPSTKAALRAVGVSILIELIATLVAAGIWLAGALAT